jgi:DUF1009 family protein
MTLAIIAGNGELPKLIIKQCKAKKREFVVILVEGNPNKNDFVKYNHEVVAIGHVSKALSILKANKVKQIVFAGGIKKPSFSHVKVDKKGAVLLSKIVANKMFGDDNILTTITNFFKKEGFEIVGTHDIVDNLVFKKGVLTNNKPSKDDLENIKIGKNALNTLSDLDIGQGLAIQQKQVIGVEAVEGTDELIKRCAKFSFKEGSKTILIKIKKKNQNTKIDLPTIGLKTISSLVKANFSGIAIEAGSTLIVDKEKVIDLANKNNMFIIAI